MKPTVSRRGYSQRLTPEMTSEGMKAALENAQSLLDDAEILLQANKWARATALAILAIEEAGKPILLREILLARDEKELARAWVGFRRHSEKNQLWIAPELASRGARTIDDVHILSSSSDHGERLETLKQIALYSDADSACSWSIPDRTVGKETATAVVEIARALVPKEPGGMTSADELMLLVEFVGPVWNADLPTMTKAMARCYQEAERRGYLRGKLSAADMVRFLGKHARSVGD